MPDTAWKNRIVGNAVIVERWQNLTGEKATRDGQPSNGKPHRKPKNKAKKKLARA